MTRPRFVRKRFPSGQRPIWTRRRCFFGRAERRRQDRNRRTQADMNLDAQTRRLDTSAVLAFLALMMRGSRVTESMFSSSWYRAASLKPRLRSHARIHRHHYRGQLWYVLLGLSGRPSSPLHAGCTLPDFAHGRPAHGASGLELGYGAPGRRCADPGRNDPFAGPVACERFAGVQCLSGQPGVVSAFSAPGTAAMAAAVFKPTVPAFSADRSECLPDPLALPGQSAVRLDGGVDLACRSDDQGAGPPLLPICARRRRATIWQSPENWPPGSVCMSPKRRYAKSSARPI